MLFGVAILLAASTASVDPGPEPSWQQATTLGNQALLSRLVDPESARVAWPYGFFGGSLKGLLTKRTAGWITCGLVNAKNQMGGYTGALPFLIVIKDGQVAELDIGSPDEIDAASATCPSLVKKGLIRPSGAPFEPAPIASSEQAQDLAAAAASLAAKGSIGISFIPSAAGIVLMAVAPGSPAASAGLRAGEVIQSANGINFRGMDQASATAALHSLPKTAELGLSDGSKVTLSRP